MQAATKRNVIALCIVFFSLFFIAQNVMTKNQQSERADTSQVATFPTTDVETVLQEQYGMLKGTKATQAFIAISGVSYTKNDELVQVYTFPSAEEAEFTKQSIGTDGYSIGTSMYDWILPPHFYQKSNVVVLYFGKNPKLLDYFSQQLGAPFVNASTN